MAKAEMNKSKSAAMRIAPDEKKDGCDISRSIVSDYIVPHDLPGLLVTLEFRSISKSQFIYETSGRGVGYHANKCAGGDVR